MTPPSPSIRPACLVERNKVQSWKKEPEGPDKGNKPLTPMSLSILNVFQQAWRLDTVPNAWCGSIVISLPKQGDLTDTGNYHGISLMSTALKIICVILSGRINTKAEAASCFSPSQAGFRGIPLLGRVPCP